MVISGHRSPTGAIDLVFDIQGGLFRLMAGADPHDELLEVESLNRQVSWV